MAIMRRFAVLGWALALAAGAAGVVRAQNPQAGAGQANAQQANSAQQAGTAQTSGVGQAGAGQTAVAAGDRTRLILKDGSYQVVMSYQVKGEDCELHQRRARRDRGDSGAAPRLGRDDGGSVSIR